MSFLGLLSNSVDVYRQTAGAGRVMSRQKVVTGQATLIQPMGADEANAADMAMGRSYNAFFPEGSDIEIGDRLIDQNNIAYTVRGLMDRKYGHTPHMTATLESAPVGQT